MDEPSRYPPGRPVLLFDGSCGFCTSAVRRISSVLGVPSGEAPALVPFQVADLERLGVTESRAEREVLWVASDGTVAGGAQAFACWLRCRRGPYGWLGLILQLPGIRLLAAGVYRLVAANRSRLPGGTPACAASPVTPTSGLPKHG